MILPPAYAVSSRGSNRRSVEYPISTVKHIRTVRGLGPRDGRTGSSAEA